MSIKTNFKRIALVAVAALGMGVLSSVPSQAILNADYITVTAATTNQKIGETYTSTGAFVTIGFLAGTAATDSVSVTASLVSGPSTSSSLPYLRLTETSNALVDSRTTTGVSGSAALTATTSPNVETTIIAAAAGQAYATFALYMGGTSNAAPTVAGTYVVRITPRSQAPSNNGLISTFKDVTLTVAANDNVASTLSTFYIQSGVSDLYTPTTDSVVSAVSTASTTGRARIFYTQKNAAGTALTGSTSLPGESMTVSITGAGTLGSAAGAVSSVGRNITVKNTDSIVVFSDGTSGTGTITIKGATSGTTLATKTVSFYSTTVATATAGLVSSVMGASGTAVYGVAKDSTGTAISSTTGGLYAFSSDLTVVSDSGTACAWSSADSVAYCTLTGLKDGTAKIKLGNSSAGANTVTSNEVTVRVSLQPIASIKLTLDKTTYAPNEKATLRVVGYDAAGKVVPGASYTSLLASGGITSSMALGSSSDTTTAVSFATAATATSTDPVKEYTVYMPASGGTVTFTATGGSALPAAAQVKTTVTATVTDSGAAALAAVNALATTVASLRTLITTLTNLVLKIQKKVKA